MSTNATFTIRHPDGTFSNRYHHWDGYVDGLGVFLNKAVNTPEKIKHVLEANKDFATLMAQKTHEEGFLSYAQKEYKENKKKGLVLEWSNIFDLSENSYARCLEPEANDDFSDKNHVSWESLFENNYIGQEYDYVFTDNSWHVLLNLDQDFTKLHMITVDDYLTFGKISTATDFRLNGYDLDEYLKSSKLTKKQAKDIMKKFNAWPEQKKECMLSILDFFDREDILATLREINVLTQKDNLKKEIEGSGNSRTTPKM